jgi:LPS-assembly protein
MRDRFSLLIFLLPFSILVLSPDVHAKIDEPKIARGVGAGPVEIQADELLYEQEGKIYEAHGHVEVVRGDLVLRADHGRLNMATKDVAAWGNVSMAEGEDFLECERLEVNLETRMGKVHNAKLFMKEQNFHISGQEAEKLGENRYRVRDVSFTTCDAKRPPWKFTAKELDVNLEGYGTVKKAVFHVEDLPVLYLPWMTFPVRRERQTGFLLPEVAYSDREGIEARTAFYWAMSKNMDSTFYLNYFQERGLQGGLEYRYALTRDSKGQANAYFIDDREYGGNRYAFFVRNEQELPYDFYLKGDVNYVSDNQYPQDFDDDLPWGAKIDSRSLKLLRSTVYGGKNWDRFNLLAQGLFYQDLTESNIDDTLQQLPQIIFTAQPQSLYGNLLFGDLSSSYNYFWRDRGVTAHRWDLFPRISLPTRLFDVLKLEGSVAGRETLYRIDNDSSSQFDEWESRETYEAAAKMGVEFYRVYESGLFSKLSGLYGVRKWMHTFEPTVGYVYNPGVDQEDLPFFNQVDRIPYRSEFLYGFTTRLVGKPVVEGVDSGPREFANLKVFQSYSLGDPFVSQIGGEPREFSNIGGELWLYFGPYVTAQANAEFNPYDTNFDQLNGLLMLRDRRQDGLNIEYRFTRDQIEELNLYTKFRTIDPLYIYLAFRYNLRLDAWVERIYGVEYQAQCWAVGLSVEDWAESPDGTQDSELKVVFYLRLLGVGSVGRKRDL